MLFHPILPMALFYYNQDLCRCDLNFIDDLNRRELCIVWEPGLPEKID